VSFSFGRSGIQVGFHSSQVVVHGETPGSGALGEKDILLNVRIEGELESDGPREDLAGVRESRSRRT
jgi:hypothetical protein